MTDATRNNAEQWHIPPAGDAERPRLGEGMSPVPSYYAPPPLVTKAGCDIGPLVAIIDREMQRLRDQLAVERGAASSAREALAACEERLMIAKRDVDHVRHELEHAKQGEAEAQRMLLDERKNIARAQLEQAKTVPAGVVPGSADAVKEAVRLLTGQEPQVCAMVEHHIDPYWAASGGKTATCNEARMALLKHLEELQPAATVAT